MRSKRETNVFRERRNETHQVIRPRDPIASLDTVVEEVGSGGVAHLFQDLAPAFLGQTNCALKSKNRV